MICLGPTSDDYGEDRATHAWTAEERRLREPIRHLASIRIPTYVIEGEHGNIDSLRAMKRASKNADVTFVEIPDADHFQIIHPVNELFADAINASKTGKLDIDATALRTCWADQERRRREAADLRNLADTRSRGLDLGSPRTVTFYLLAQQKNVLEQAAKDRLVQNFQSAAPKQERDRTGNTYFVLTISKKIDLLSLLALFDASDRVTRVAANHEAQYDGWTAR